jgi:hypothetical protein
LWRSCVSIVSAVAIEHNSAAAPARKACRGRPRRGRGRPSTEWRSPRRGLDGVGLPGRGAGRGRSGRGRGCPGWAGRVALIAASGQGCPPRGGALIAHIPTPSLLPFPVARSGAVLRRSEPGSPGRRFAGVALPPLQTDDGARLYAGQGLGDVRLHHHRCWIAAGAARQDATRCESPSAWSKRR